MNTSELQDAVKEENRRIRRLRICVDFTIQCLMTQPMSATEAQSLIRGARGLTSELFPGKEAVFDLIYLPRLRRALRESLGNRPADHFSIIDGGRNFSK